MRFNRLQRMFLALCAALALVPAIASAQAQDYPNRLVRLIVGFAPGGGADIGPAFDRALAAVRGGTPALVNVLVDCKVGEQRADPQLQTMPFNHEWFAGRSKQSKP